MWRADQLTVGSGATASRVDIAFVTVDPLRETQLEERTTAR